MNCLSRQNHTLIIIENEPMKKHYSQRDSIIVIVPVVPQKFTFCKFSSLRNTPLQNHALTTLKTQELLRRLLERVLRSNTCPSSVRIATLCPGDTMRSAAIFGLIQKDPPFLATLELICDCRMSALPVAESDIGTPRPGIGEVELEFDI
jgi:hypothetical protein